MITILSIVGMLLLLCLSAFFSSSESALFSLDPLQVKRISEKKGGAGRRIERLLSSPSQLLSAILIGNTLVNVAASSMGHSLFEHAIPHYGIFIAVPVITLLLLVFGEVTPKRVARRRDRDGQRRDFGTPRYTGERVVLSLSGGRARPESTTLATRSGC